MAIHIDRQYASLIGSQLDGFTQRGNSISFRCPYCGDSQKFLKKKRGNLFESGDSLIFHCFNCGESKGFSEFLKFVDSFSIYREYRQEVFLYNNSFNSKKSLKRTSPGNYHVRQSTENVGIFTELDSILKLSFKNSSHPACKYIRSRGIPSKYLDEIYWTENFKEFHNEHSIKKLESDIFESGRIIFPIISQDGVEYGFQGREIENGEIRYLTSIFRKNYTKQYGMHNIDLSKTVFVLEGGIDSMFLENGIAALDGSLSTVADELGLSKQNTILIYDNEPRNKEIMNIMNKSISNGWRVSFWKDEREAIKDINDLYLTGNLSIEEISKEFEGNSFFGLKAKMKFQQYNKT